MDSFAREALGHPAFRAARWISGNSCQFPLAALTQEATEQRVVVEPLAGVGIHALNKQPLAFNFFKAHLAVFFTGHTSNERVVH